MTNGGHNYSLYMTPLPPRNESISSSIPNEMNNNNNTNSVHTNMNQWCCDICNVAWFPTYEEACEHELGCTRIPIQQQQEQEKQQTKTKPDKKRVTKTIKKTATGTTFDVIPPSSSSQPELPPPPPPPPPLVSVQEVEMIDLIDNSYNQSFVQKNRIDTTNDVSHGIETYNDDMVVVTSWLCDYCQTSFPSEREALVHEQSCILVSSTSSSSSSASPLLFKKRTEKDDQTQKENMNEKRSCIPPNATTTIRNNTTTTNKNENVVQKLESAPVWYCDICNVVCFDTEEAAIVHEKTCVVDVQKRKYLRKNNRKEEDHTTGKMIIDLQKSTSTDQSNSSSCEDSDDNSSYEMENRTKKESNHNKKQQHHHQQQRTKIKLATTTTLQLRPPPPSTTAKNIKKKNTPVHNNNDSHSDRNMNTIGKKRIRTTTDSRNGTKKNIHLAPIFGTSATSTTIKNSTTQQSCKNNSNELAEQRLIEFQMKRAIQLQNERERQQKRLKQLQEQQVVVEIMDEEKDTFPFTNDSNIKREQKNLIISPGKKEMINHKKNMAAVRFPIPSHVFSCQKNNNNNTTTCTNDCTTCGKMNCIEEGQDVPIFLNTSGGSNSKSILLLEPFQKESYHVLEDVSPFVFPYSFKQSVTIHGSSIEPLFTEEKSILIKRSLLSIVTPPKGRCIDIDDDEKRFSSLVEKHCTIKDLDTDLVGENMKDGSKQLRQFIEQWMMERQQANNRMVARQKKLVAASNKKPNSGKRKSVIKPKKKSTVYDDDDDDDFLWDDDDDSENDDVPDLPTLFLLHGPIGCGKSSLVYAVANTCGCKVIEVNTSQQRGSVGLKKILSEATQSHSSFDLLQKEKKKKTTSGSMFFRPTCTTISDTDSDCKKPTKQQQQHDKASLTIVLIDEVDLMYEDDGDNGFWTALNEVCKRSKCPIILTANTYPRQLDSSSFRFQQVALHCPTSMECIPKIKNILNTEGFVYGTKSVKEIDTVLNETIQLAGCDLRRIVHTIENLVGTDHTESTVSVPFHIESKNARKIEIDSTLPIVQSIEPRALSANVFSQITIHGINFNSFGRNRRNDPNVDIMVSVLIGNRICPKAYVLNDSTIMAVAAPIILPKQIDISGYYRGTRQRSFDVSYAPIAVCSSRRTVGQVPNMMKTSRNVLQLNESVDDSIVLTPVGITNVEYHFPGYTTHTLSAKDGHSSDVNSDEENEFMDEDIPKESISTLGESNSSIQSLNSAHDEKVAINDLDNRVKAWKNENTPVVESEVSHVDSECMSYEDIELISFACNNASDAVYLEDIGMNGLPFLSGPCRGFGFEYTEDYPRRTNENSKPPSENTLFTNGWKDNSSFYGSNDWFCSYPVTGREKLLLKRSVHMTRGYPLPNGDPMEFSDEDDDEYAHVRLNSNRSEEDAFLSNDAPACLMELPSVLMSHNTSVPTFSHPTPITNYLVTKTRIEKTNAHFNMLYHHVFPQDESYKRHLTRGQTDIVNESMPPTIEGINQDICLDYLPILRGIAVAECIADTLYKISTTSSATGSDEVDMKGDRWSYRRTRRSHQMGRKNYFENLVPSYVWKETDVTPSDLIQKLAESSLTYYRKKERA